jgi:hypothetical protein
LAGCRVAPEQEPIEILSTQDAGELDSETLRQQSHNPADTGSNSQRGPDRRLHLGRDRDTRH